MKTMLCPFCGKEIKKEAILCKYCRKLLIDDNGNILPPQNQNNESAPEPEVTENVAEVQTEKAPAEATEVKETAAEETASDNDEDKTIVYSKEELKKAMEEAAASGVSSEEITEQAENNLAEDEKNAEAEADENESDEAAYIEDYDDEGAALTAEDLDDSEEAAEEYDAKRVFAITAIITLGILILIIAAVGVGWKLFGGSSDSSSQADTVTTTTAATTTAAPDDDSFEEYVPQVTDDTVSEDPEEITNSDQADPVTETESLASTDDSALDSDTDSSDDSSSTDSTDSTASVNADDSPSFEPAGSYYSWNEALQLWENFKTNHGYNDESAYYTTLSYCPDDYTMVFICRELESGNSTYYSLDLYTGTFTTVE